MSQPVLQRSPEVCRFSLESQIGSTPLVRLRNVARGLPEGVEIYCKAEHLNPGGSVKDRAALSMILDGERSGKLYKGKTILDATSGNTGIAYAMIGAARGYPVTLALPKNASSERKRLLRLYGATIIETDPMSGTDGAQLLARELAAKHPDEYFYPDQYNNNANWRAHYNSTAPEIWQQIEGRITHFVATLGTSGTFTGVSRRLKELKPELKALSVQPETALHGIEGAKHMASAIVPGIYDPQLADDDLYVATEDARVMTARLAREEGLFVGISSGANVFAAIRVAENLGPGSVIVTILADTGSRYSSEDLG